MEVRFERSGAPVSVVLDLTAGTVTIDGRTHPFRVVASDGDRIELEIDGERAVVEPWPVGLARPSSLPAVNGERTDLTLVAIDPGTSRGIPGPRPVPGTSPAPTVPGATGPAPGEGVAVVPPMPGKVLEVRVQEGETVAVGQVLLVLEAMKMRNEISATRAGRVRELRATPGANVRAREPLLRIVPD